MERLRALLAIMLLGVPATSRAATFVYLSSAGPEEPVLGGRRLRLTPTNVYRHPDPDGAGVAISLQEDGLGRRYWLYLVPPPGQQFAPGSYDGAGGCGTGTRPGVCV